MSGKMGQLSAAGLTQHSAETRCGSVVHSYLRLPAPQGKARPILVLLHGYPQTSFMWRHVVELLPDDIPLFIPDLPGYGQSTPSMKGHDKRTIGVAILEALDALLEWTSTGATPQPIVLAGHDRGARVCHRLAVDFGNQEHVDDSFYKHLLSGSFQLEGAVLIDIIPTVEQWRSFSKPAAAAGSYHWSFLANMPLAFDMIKAYGPARYCKDLISRWQGDNPVGLYSDAAVEVYSAAFENDAVVRATCEDYVAGAAIDVEEQEKDQRAGRKMDGSVLVIYSQRFLGKGGATDVGGIWSNWIKSDANLEVKAITGGAGHFIAEEAPEKVAEVLMSWRDTV